MSWIYNLLVVVVVTLITVVGDIFLKNATQTEGYKQVINMSLGVGVYIIVAFGFFYMYKLMEFSVSGVLYAVITILLFVGVGAILYQENINTYEWVGVILAIISVILLSRFA